MLRSFTPADQDAVRTLVLAGMRERWGSAFDPDRNQDVNDIVGSFIAAGGEVVLVERDGEIVATGTLLPQPPDAGRLVRMSVAQTRRREGLGRQVVAELIERARRRGMTCVRVATDTPWLSAVALYRACGFEEVGVDDTDTHFELRL